ncbi:GNAT family N-acetyltransferase [Salinibacterium sp. SYSU T00001]|uniref:GNAT family N-acetyltransferase n=1 Tax=Homoserinimonas sedimenticola TaxID=2986805 RepID=UPI00223559D9|nr:GNAT family N-acetyltransferase [Salinibacterium sedimenticola]MCW4384877.1 GNAT family N-acetyltransferase [Salinibacterium sedimenticola]
MSIEITELRLPDAIDGSPDADAFSEMVRVRNEIEAAIIGNYDLGVEPAELLAIAKNPYDIWRCFVARIDGRVVARGLYEVQGRDDADSAWFQIEVLPAFRRRGVGGALYERLSAIAHDEGRSILQSSAYHLPGGEGEHITSPTGFGSVLADDEPVRFLTSRGFRLAQVERMSRLPLPSGVGEPVAPEGYEVLTWEGATPEEHLADMAVLHARMSTDPPLGEVDWTPEVWDEERVRDNDARRGEDGRLWLTAVVRHGASGRLVGFTDLSVPPEQDRPVFQMDTVVIAEHRGHRLGMLLKRANLHALDTRAPGHPAIYTWNAEENRHMLGVNEAVGFVAFGYESSWRRDV